MNAIGYFDNGATTFPKPERVVREVGRCLCEYSGNPGRGSHTLALKAAEKLYETRELACEMFGCPSPDGVVFTYNATYALNMAILGLVNKGDHVLISDLEHNSVVRPVEHLKSTLGVQYDVFSTDGNILENIRAKLKRNTSAVICIHASNVTNRVLPIEKIGRMLNLRGIKFIVDASQSAGAYKIDMERAKISALCMPGHKGLLGPQGAGMAIFSPELLPKAIITGGSGVLSRETVMPSVLPERLEAGTLSTPCIAGLCEGMKYVKDRGLYEIRQWEKRIIDSVKGTFDGDRRVRTYSSGEGAIWLFNVKGLSSQKTAQLLDKKGICTRAGLHCSPLAHKKLNTPEDGAVRVSAGPFNTREDAQKLISALKDILREIP